MSNLYLLNISKLNANRNIPQIKDSCNNNMITNF